MAIKHVNVDDVAAVHAARPRSRTDAGYALPVLLQPRSGGLAARGQTVKHRWQAEETVPVVAGHTDQRANPVVEMSSGRSRRPARLGRDAERLHLAVAILALDRGVVAACSLNETSQSSGHAGSRKIRFPSLWSSMLCSALAELAPWSLSGV